MAALRRKLETYAPNVVAFNGKRAACEFLGRSPEYGLQPERVSSTAVFVLPSTSGAARGRWDQRPWYQLAEYVQGSRR